MLNFHTGLSASYILTPQEYFSKLPSDIKQRETLRLIGLTKPWQPLKVFIYLSPDSKGKGLDKNPKESSMRILIINPNSSVEMTKTMDSAAKKYAMPGMEITSVNPPDGPAFIANAHDSEIQVPKVIGIIEENKDNYDYFILACGYDPGIDSCRLVSKNIIGIGEAAILTACSVARRFSFLSTTAESAASVPEKLRSLGIDPGRCASARPVGTSDEIVKKRHEMFDVYCEVGRRCVDEDGAGALILSCAGMSDLKESLEQRLKVPVIAGVISAIKIAEQFDSVPHP